VNHTMDDPQGPSRLADIEAIGESDIDVRLDKLVEVEAALREELGSPGRDEQASS
jgi:hypothetical protein